jgi:2-oxo-3-hexenedioate decarboxylase/2-keto-4-pentenoate hydratase
MTGDRRINEAARRLFDDQRSNRDLASLPEGLRPHTLADAYAVQDRLLELCLAHGDGALAGWKIALTTPVMQKLVGVDHPCEGAILASRVHSDSAVLRHADYVSLGVESEIAVRLGRDLGEGGAPYDPDGAAEAVAEAMAAIEIVDTRNADFAHVDGPLLVADNSMNRGCVLGRPVENWRDLDLAALTMRMTINGDVVGEGVGADVLGDPLKALAWLANNLVRRGRPLRAGAIVLLGSIVATRWLKPGDAMSSVAEGLGEAHVRVR